MPIPDYQAIMLPLLQFAGDGKEHSLTEDVPVQPEPIGTAEGRKRPVPGVVIFLMGLLMGGLVGAVAVYSHNEKRSHYTGTYTKDNDGDGRFDEEEIYTPFGLVEKTAKIP